MNWKDVPPEDYDKYEIEKIILLVKDPFGDHSLLAEDNDFFLLKKANLPGLKEASSKEAL